MCINYKTHIPQTLKINEIKINKHSNTVLCIPTRWSYTHSSVPNFVDHCSRGDVVKSSIWAKQNPGLVQNLWSECYSSWSSESPCVWRCTASTENTSAHSPFIIFFNLINLAALALYCCEGFLQLQHEGLPCCRAQAPGAWTASCGAGPLEHRLSSCGAPASLLLSMWDLLRPGLTPMSPGLAGRLNSQNTREVQLIAHLIWTWTF